MRNKNELKSSHKNELNLQRINHDNQISSKAIENEKTYDKLQENLSQIKTKLQDTKAQLIKEHEMQIKGQKSLHDVTIAKNNQDNSLKLEDANNSVQLELNRLNRNYNKENQNLQRDSSNEARILKGSQKNEIELEKQVFREKYARLEGTNSQALFKMRADHSRLKTTEERKNLKTIKEKQNIYSSEIARIDSDGAQKKKTKQLNFETEYQKQYQDHENLINTLMKNKEKIVKEFTDELTQKFEIGISKNEDDFYEFTTLEIDINEAPEKDGYTISIPVKEHEANKIKMAGEGREIRVTMEREYKNTLSENNETDMMSKVQTMTAKRNVEDILDPQTVSKQYKNGRLTFTILKA